MAQGDLLAFYELLDDLFSGVHNIHGGTDTLKLMLCNNTTAPTQSTSPAHKTTFTEVSGTGYTAGGETLTYTGTRATGVWTLEVTAQVSWTQNGAGPTDIYWGIIYNDSATNKECLVYIDFAGPVSLQAGDVTWNDSGSGVFTFTI